MLKGGQIDAAPVSPSDVAGLTSSPNFQVVTGPTPDTWQLEYPIWNYPYNQLAFRQALAYAINRTDLVQTALAGYGKPGNEGYIPPENNPEFNSSVPEYNYNPQMAESLLQSLGWTKNSAGYYQTQNGTVFSPTVYAPAELQPQVTTATRIVQDLRAVGIDAQVQTMASTSMVDIWEKGTNMYLYEQNYGDPNSELITFRYAFDGFGTGPPLISDAAHPVFTPPSVWAYFNQTVNNLYAAGTADLRNQYMQTLQGILAQQLPVITLYYVNSVWVVNTANFGGWPTSPSTMDWPGGMFNMTALASIYSLSAQSMTSSSSSSSATPSGSSMTTYLIGAVVVIILVAAVAMKARKKSSGTTTTNP
jgi:peptide/nickel transport system substrate-binding protein